MQVNNKFIGFIFNRFDFLIRFFYCRSKIISSLFRRILFWRLYSSDFQKLDEKFEHMYALLEDNHINLEGKVVLELGPGNSYINAFNFLLKGAKKVVLVDKYSRHIDTVEQRRFFDSEMAFIKRKYACEELFFIDENKKIKSEYIEFFEADIIDLPEREKPVDFLYSVSVLEHVRDVNRTLDKLVSMMGPSSCMYHHIDLRDHYNFNHPFLFYKYNDYFWENFLTREGISYTNRWRFDDFKQKFDSLNLNVIDMKLKKYSLVPTKIASQFKGKSNLDVGLVDILLKK